MEAIVFQDSEGLGVFMKKVYDEKKGRQRAGMEKPYIFCDIKSALRGRKEGEGRAYSLSFKCFTLFGMGGDG